jgi:Asp-tRNA(Asn)/Glu-tRNA(Gln) amidotransferase A subunit family amidase
MHSDNRVWGCALNPWNNERSCGGSSGGDSGLVAARCTPLALGTDLGGSLRVPAHFNGIWTFKPSGKRTSITGARTALPDNFTPFN